MSVINLTAEACGVQHSVPAASNLTGIRADNGDATIDKARHVVVHPEEAANGGGLFLPADDFLAIRTHAFCTDVHLISTAGFSWTVAVTSGLGSGDATTLDAIAEDGQLASGTDSSLVRLNYELLPGQAIRVVTSGGTAAITVIAKFALTLSDAGRLIV